MPRSKDGDDVAYIERVLRYKKAYSYCGTKGRLMQGSLSGLTVVSYRRNENRGSSSSGTRPVLFIVSPWPPVGGRFNGTTSK